MSFDQETLIGDRVFCNSRESCFEGFGTGRRVSRVREELERSHEVERVHVGEHREENTEGL